MLLWTLASTTLFLEIKRTFEKFIRKPGSYKLGFDWMVLFKHSITDGLLQTAIAMAEANKNYNAAHKVWVKGMMDMKRSAGTPIYPDANSTPASHLRTSVTV